VLPNGRFPLACLFLTVDLEQVDINVHPRKEEVQVLHPGRLETSIQTAIKVALEEHVATQIKQAGGTRTWQTDTNSVHTDASFDRSAALNHALQNQLDRESFELEQATSKEFESFETAPWASSGRTDLILSPTRLLKTDNLIDTEGFAAPSPSRTMTPLTISKDYAGWNGGTPESNATLFHDRSNALSRATKDFSTQEEIYTETNTALPESETFEIIGYFNKTYILLAHKDGMLVVDQHAAHERVLYELFSATFKNVPTMRLLFPITCTVSIEDRMLLEGHLQLFHDNGIIVEPFGSNQIIIQETPIHLKNAPLGELIKQTIGWMREHPHTSEREYPNINEREYNHPGATDFSKAINEKLHAQMACKAAVKAGDQLSTEHINNLIRDLYKTTNRLTCPHGRPTSWMLSTYDIEKKFKRV